MIAGHHVRQALRPCMGCLRFSHYEHVPVIDKRSKKTVKTIRKSFFKCQRCGDLVSVIVMPSYNDYIERGV